MTLLIRVDAGKRMGTGHFMRCLALAQAWLEAGGKVVFVCGESLEFLKDRLRVEELEVNFLSTTPGSNEDAIQTAELAQELKASWVVVDGYHFSAEYQRAIKQHDLRLLFIDDNGHCDHYYADIVLNQNVHASPELYASREPYTRCLLGTQYVLLRREFWGWADWTRTIPEVARKILVTLGGSDPENVTMKVITAVEQVELDGLEATVVIGGGNPYKDQLQLAAQGSKIPIHIESNTTRMPELMAWADVAVSSGGSTCWELAFMGLPHLILVVADNQVPIARELDKLGIARCLGWYSTVLPEDIASHLEELLPKMKVRSEMSGYGRQLVDGKGAKRVVKNFLDFTLTLRPVRREDCALLWKWANDPTVREVSFSLDPIPWEKHVYWFESKLADPLCLIFIGVSQNDEPIGQVRFELSDNDKAEIHVVIDESYRGQGYGSKLIDLAVTELFRNTSVQSVNAFVKSTNHASMRAFEKAGFKKIGAVTIKRCESLHYKRTRSYQ